MPAAGGADRLLGRLAAVLFDFGDTLFHSPSGARLLAEEGLEPAQAEGLWDEIWRDSKAVGELAKRRDLSPEAHRAAWTALFARADPLLPGVSGRLYERVMRPAGWTPYPDALPTVRELHAQGVRVGVISNITSPLRPVFEAHGFASLVGAYTHSFEHGHEKPERELFLAACGKLGSPPAETLMVGDSHLADGGGVEAGLPVLLLPPVRPGEPRGLDLVLRLFG